MKFTSFKNWLLERAAEKMEYACIMLSANIPDWKQKLSIVAKEDLYKVNDDYGYERDRCLHRFGL